MTQSEALKIIAAIAKRGSEDTEATRDAFREGMASIEEIANLALSSDGEFEQKDSK